MQRWLRSLFVLICIGRVAGPPALAEQPITIENSELEVALSAENATLLSVTRKRINSPAAGSVKQAGWFRVEIPLPYWEGHKAASQDLKAITTHKLGPDSVEVQAAQLLSKEGSYAISTKLTLRLERDNLVCKLTLQNRSEQTVDRVVFPILDVPPASDGKELLILPHIAFPLRAAFNENDVRTDHNPFDTMDPLDAKAWIFNDPKISMKTFDYPIYLPTGWSVLLADGKGIGFDVHDQDMQYQRFLVERRLYRDALSPEANRHDYELSWNWYPLVRPNTSWESPEVYLKFDNGDWHGVAGQHRDWMKTRIHRPEVANELQSSIGWLSRSIKSYDQIPVEAQRGVEVGAPYIILYGWSQISAAGMSYSAYPRTDSGGIESLQRNLVKARELGSHPLAWYNGTLSVEQNPDHWTQGIYSVALDRWGGAILGGQWSMWEPSQIATRPNNDVWLEKDPSSSGDFMLATIRRFVEDYHFSGFEMDQAYKSFLSYRDAEKGGQPALRYCRGYADFYTRAQALVKKNDPDGIIVGEGYSDFLDQYVDSSWVFEGGPLNVPLQTVLRYSMPWVTVPVRAVVTDKGLANQAFVMNSPLDIFDDLSQYPDFSKHLKLLHALKRLTAHYFYEGEFSDTEGFSFRGGSPKQVLAKSYTDPARKFLVVVVANAAETPMETTLHLDLPFAAREVRHYYLDGRLETHNRSAEFRLLLAAFDVQVLAFETE